MNIIEACDKAATVISQVESLDRLYRRGLKCLGDGRLRSGVMDLASEAIKDEKLSGEIMVSDENMVGFLCGVWVQYLLVEIAGLEKDKLHRIAQRAFVERAKDGPVN
ncbi:MAG: hypothetical protein LLG06_14020 [Desulfobacteraceae bacterium]|nr:hypothetical protein [Desulfobacteraceae bacterium]